MNSPQYKRVGSAHSFILYYFGNISIILLIGGIILMEDTKKAMYSYYAFCYTYKNKDDEDEYVIAFPDLRNKKMDELGRYVYNDDASDVVMTQADTNEEIDLTAMDILGYYLSEEPENIPHASSREEFEVFNPKDYLSDYTSVKIIKVAVRVDLVNILYRIGKLLRDIRDMDLLPSTDNQFYTGFVVDPDADEMELISCSIDRKKLASIDDDYDDEGEDYGRFEKSYTYPIRTT